MVIDADALPNATQFETLDRKTGARPDVTEARIVVSGGRAFKNSEDFEQHVGGLADALGAEFLQFDVDQLVQDYVNMVSAAVGYQFRGMSCQGAPLNGSGSLGRPRTRSPMMFRCTSLEPP